MRGFLLTIAGVVAAVGVGAVWGAVEMSPNAPAELRAAAGGGGFVLLLVGLGLLAVVEKKFGSRP